MSVTIRLLVRASSTTFPFAERTELTAVKMLVATAAEPEVVWLPVVTVPLLEEELPEELPEEELLPEESEVTSEAESKARVVLSFEDATVAYCNW